MIALDSNKYTTKETSFYKELPDGSKMFIYDPIGIIPEFFSSEINYIIGNINNIKGLAIGYLPDGFPYIEGGHDRFQLAVQTCEEYIENRNKNRYTEARSSAQRLSRMLKTSTRYIIVD